MSDDICHRYFFALQPTARALPAIAAHRDAAPGGHSHVSDQRIHLTIAITHDFDAPREDIVSCLKEIGDRVAVDPFIVTLDRVSGTADPEDDDRGSVALRSSRTPKALSNLSVQLCAPMRHWRILRDKWALRPHTTGRASRS